MRTRLLTGLALLTSLTLHACAGEESGGDCVSHYDVIARAPTFGQLKAALLDHEERGQVSSLRTRAKGPGVGVDAEKTVRVMDLLTKKGRRLAQVEVWRTDGDRWRAGIWLQCID